MPELLTRDSRLTKALVKLLSEVSKGCTFDILWGSFGYALVQWCVAASSNFERLGSNDPGLSFLNIGETRNSDNFFTLPRCELLCELPSRLLVVSCWSHSQSAFVLSRQCACSSSLSRLIHCPWKLLSPLASSFTVMELSRYPGWLRHLDTRSCDIWK